MSTKICYPAVFQKEESGYSVWIPDIPGCISQGDDFEEAVNYITEAIGICLEDSLENGEKMPAPSSPDAIQTERGQFVSVVMFDPVEYQRKYSGKAIKKTLTIPAWLNTASERAHINFSQVLQEALMERLHISNA